MNITEKINAIVIERAKHLPDIQKQRKHLLNIKEQLDNLEGLVSVVNEGLNSGAGPYCRIMAENPKMELAFRSVNTGEVRGLISRQLEKLEILEKRFSRKTICIAMIGYERQGKSTFLQTISGLSNNVIPAYSGTSCTGAVSVIHNIDGPFRAEIELFTEQEFLKIVKEKLLKFFPERRYEINSVNDLRTINLSGFSASSVVLSTEFNKFRDAYCGHVDEYASLLGTNKLTISNEADVIKHVAQYEEFSAIPEGESASNFEQVNKNDGSVVYKKNYYKYIAVKNVNIFTKFNIIDSTQIELVDTIGMGDSSNADLIEAEMFRVLREDCDAAVNLFKPDALGGGFNQTQADILTKISTELKDRDPSKWIVYVVNKVTSGMGVNTANIPDILNKSTAAISNLPIKPVAWVKDVQGNDLNEVRDKLVNPLLDLITDNLGELDNNLMAEANAFGKDLFAAYFKLTNNVSAVLTSSIQKSKSEGALFDKLYSESQKKLYSALRNIDENVYGRNRSIPCPEIEESLKCSIKNVYDVLPEEESIAEKVDIGRLDLASIFSLYCDEFSNSIYKIFEDVSENIIVPLREKVKKDIVTLLYNEGMLGKIVLENHNTNQGPTVEWLKCLVDERVDKETYPHFYEALMYIYTYRFNIEDSIEYNVAKSLGSIDKMNIEEYIPLEPVNGTVNERAHAIWEELVNRIPTIQTNLRKYSGEFALIPSHSFWTRVSKFRMKVVRDENVIADMREFYRNNAYAFWRNDFMNIVAEGQAFDGWKNINDSLLNLRVKECFEL